MIESIVYSLTFLELGVNFLLVDAYLMHFMKHILQFKNILSVSFLDTVTSYTYQETETHMKIVDD